MKTPSPRLRLRLGVALVVGAVGWTVMSIRNPALEGIGAEPARDTPAPAQGSHQSTPKTRVARSPQPGQPWENSLGMKFVPVPATEVLFCIWETRVQDFAAFVDATGHDATADMYSLRQGAFGKFGATWRSPGFSQGPTHPVVGVNWADAEAFCSWLTARERREGRLNARQHYRLPTDSEWDRAVGTDTYPWGNDWPPPPGAGNYADLAAKRKYPERPVISGYDDGHADTAPVGSFTPNRLGLYDLGGNVWERVGDRSFGVRGASYFIHMRPFLDCGVRYYDADVRYDGLGFRIVCTVPPER